MEKKFSIDLHIHTCLSPCADDAMLPAAIIGEAEKHGLDCIGICDHNSAENVPAVKKAGKRAGIQVLGGMEITTREEVHILALFEDDRSLRNIQDLVYRNLTGENDEETFGEQLIADENDRIIGSCRKLLIGATNLSLDEAVRGIRDHGGIAIASHIDREQFSVIGQLGFIPEHLPLHALELSPRVDARARSVFECLGFPLVTFSDAHYLTDIGKVSTLISAPKLSFNALRTALCETEQ
ncbi:MAG: PHP domain-containing protein [Candidatus Latescibacterota bacterium]